MNEFLKRLTRLFTAGKEFGARLFRRRVTAMPVLVRNIRRIGFQPRPDNRVDDVDPEIVDMENDDILGQAFNDYTAPHHSQKEFTDFTEIGTDGRLRRKSEAWEHGRNGMEGTIRDARVLVSSGLAVPPDQVAARCQNPKCRKYEAAIFIRPCSRCGRLFCGACIKQMVTHQGLLLLCPEDYRREVSQYDCWAAVDANLGKTPGIPVLPERPFAGIFEMPLQRKGRNEQKR